LGYALADSDGLSPCGLGCALADLGCAPSWLELHPCRLGLRPYGLGCALIDSDGLCPCALVAWAVAAAAATAAVEAAAVTAAVALAAAAVEVHPNGWGNRAQPGQGLHPRCLKHNNQMAARHGLVVMQQKICHYAAAGGGYLHYDETIGIVNMVDYCTV
jgi:hypothetical protein